MIAPRDGLTQREASLVLEPALLDGPLDLLLGEAVQLLAGGGGTPSYRHWYGKGLGSRYAGRLDGTAGAALCGKQDAQDEMADAGGKVAHTSFTHLL
ncbi:hypothetical protein GCM10018773_57460 [Streptomyces candidus]|nr:hypothetical protein GCM10018773_57460 [Streptomyces candidus]